MRTSQHVRLSRSGVAPGRVGNCRLAVRASASGPSVNGKSSSATTALSITASAAASALLAKVAALLAAGVGPMALPAALHASSTIYKDNVKEFHSSAAFKMSLKEKVALASAPATAHHHTAAVAFPSEWLVVTSAAEWFEQHRQADTAGALLATVFVSNKAAIAHAALLERLRRSSGAGTDAPVRFVFVHIADDYQQRHARASSSCAAAAASGLGRSASSLSLGRVSHIAALHGLDVALTLFLPDGVRAFPSLLLTAGPAAAVPATGSVDGGAASAPWSWSAATRVSDLRQLVSDWAFISDRRRREQLKQQENHQQCRDPMVAAADAEVAARRVARADASAVVVEGVVALEEHGGAVRRGSAAAANNAANSSRRRGDAAVLVRA